MAKTQLRLGQLTGSFGSAAGTINDQISPTATGSMVASDLSTVLAHMAGAIKRIHGGDSFSESQAGIFTTDIKPEANNSRVLGADIAGTPLNTPFHSSISASGLSLGSDTAIVRMTSIPTVIGQEAASGDFLAIGDFRATLAADPSSTVTFAQTFGSSLDTSSMGSTLDSSTTSIPFVSASALVAALGDDIRGGDTIVIGSFSATVSSNYSSGASLSVSSGSGSQAVSGISGGTTTSLSAGGTSGAPGGLAVTPVNGTASVSGSEISGGAATFIGRGFSKVRALNVEMNGGGRIDLDFDQDTSIRASADDVITVEVGGSDKLTVNASAIAPTGAAGMDLGTSALGFNDLHLDSGGVVNFDGGDVTMTHSSNLLDVSGGSLRADKLELDVNNHIDVDGSSDLVMTAAQALKLDAGGDIVLSADGDQVILDDGSTSQMHIDWSGSGEVAIQSLVDDDDIKLMGKSGGSDVTALTLDMSDSGRATFANDVRVGVDVEVLGDLKLGAGADEFVISESSDNITMNVAQADKSLTISGVDGSSSINALVLDMADAGKATFSGDLVVGGNVIRASDGGATITMDTSDNVTVAGDLTVSGNDIVFASGAANIGAAIGSANMTLGGSSSTVVIPGNLTVSGTTTQVDTTNMNVKDANILINDGGSTSTSPGAGLNIEEGGSVTGYMRVADDDRANLDLKAPGGSELKLDVNSDSTFTVAGNLGVEAASLINQDLTSDSTTAAFATLTVSTSLVPDGSGGADLGSTSAEFGDVYIADDKKLQFGSGQDFTIEYDEDGADVAQFAGANMRIGHGASTELQFRDGDLKINSSTDGQLDVAADTLMKVTAPTVELESSTAVIVDGPRLNLEDDGAILAFGASAPTQLVHQASSDALRLLQGSNAAKLELANSAHSIEGAASSSGALTLTAGGNIVLSPGNFAHVVPDANDGAQLGTTSLQWSDLFLADGAVINYGAGGQTITHATEAQLGSDIKSSHAPNFLSTQTFNTSLSNLQFHSLGSDISSSHAGNLSDSFLSSSDSSLLFDNATNAAAFASALGGGGARARFDDGSGGIFDIEFGSYSSGSTITIISIVNVGGTSSVSKSGLQGSGTIKVIGTSGASAAASFNSALPSSRVVRFDDNNGNKIDYTFSSYSSGASITISSASQAAGSSAVGISTIAPSGAGGSIKGVSSFEDQITISDNLVLSGHDGSGSGLVLGSTDVTATGAELNLLDGGRALDSSITIANSDGILVKDGTTMKMVPASDLKTFVGGGRSKKSATLSSAVSANAKVVIAGSENDGGDDPDLTDIYLNGQLMLSGSSASDGDYKIHGLLSSESLPSAFTISGPSTLEAGSATLTMSSLSAANAARLCPGSKLTFSNSGGSAVAVATVTEEPAASATSVSVTITMSAGSSLSVSDISSSASSFEESLRNGAMFFFALEEDDVVTSIVV